MNPDPNAPIPPEGSMHSGDIHPFSEKPRSDRSETHDLACGKRGPAPGHMTVCTCPGAPKLVYRYVVEFKPDRPSKPDSYTRVVTLSEINPCEAIRAASDQLTMDDVRLWQANELVVTVRRTA